MDKGLCQRCGKNPPAPERITCPECLETMKSNNHKRRDDPLVLAEISRRARETYQARLRDGLCAYCGKRPIEPNASSGCTVCLDKIRIRVGCKPRKSKPPQDLEEARLIRNQRNRNWRAARYASNLCMDCAGNRIETRYRCAGCLEKARLRFRRYQEKKRASASSLAPA